VAISGRMFLENGVQNIRGKFWSFELWQLHHSIQLRKVCFPQLKKNIPTHVMYYGSLSYTLQALIRQTNAAICKKYMCKPFQNQAKCPQGIP
jgi:hypothetical protein